MSVTLKLLRYEVRYPLSRTSCRGFGNSISTLRDCFKSVEWDEQSGEKSV